MTESDEWLERAEAIAERYQKQAATTGSPIYILAGDDIVKNMRGDTFHTITISIPGNVPAEALRQRIKAYAEFHGLTMTGDGLDWFLRQPQLDVPGFLKAPARRVPVPAMSLADEADLMEAHG